MTTRPMDRTTATVLAHVQAERSMQQERYSWRDDSMLTKAQWDKLLLSYLRKPGASRYIRLIQVAALAVAAAEREPGLGSSILPERESD